jgi:hypothetical protein
LPYHAFDHNFLWCCNHHLSHLRAIISVPTAATAAAAAKQPWVIFVFIFGIKLREIISQ